MKVKKLVAGILAGVIALSAVGISAFAVLSDDSSEWNGQPEVGHFRKVGTLTAQKFAHVSVAFGKKIAILFSH